MERCCCCLQRAGTGLCVPRRCCYCCPRAPTFLCSLPQHGCQHGHGPCSETCNRLAHSPHTRALPTFRGSHARPRLGWLLGAARQQPAVPPLSHAHAQCVSTHARTPAVRGCGPRTVTQMLQPQLLSAGCSEIAGLTGAGIPGRTAAAGARRGHTAPLCCVLTASWEGPQAGRGAGAASGPTACQGFPRGPGASPIPCAPAVTPCLSQGPPTGPSWAAPLPL